ncbi:MAG TPA: transporter [Dysgonomonas sp.]|nr:transporter [Dysgonomonas sp.]
MKKYILTLTLLALFATIYSQKILTLDECWGKALKNYPLIRQYDLISLSKQYSLSNLSKSYLPQFALNGQVTYQSDVTKIPVDFSSLPVPVDIPSMSKDQYKATIDASQLIWDGGTVKAQKGITKANAEVSNKKTEVQLYAVKEKVNELFFGILMIDEQLKILDLSESDMRTNRDIVDSMLKNGMAMQSDLDQIDVELLNIDQKRTEQISLREAYLKMLGLFIHQEVEVNTHLQKPEEGALLYGQINRPELSLYASQRMLYDIQNNSVKAKNMPRISLFAQGGYGRPGINMLEDRFKFFAIGGIKLSWNFGNLYTRKNERMLIENNISEVNIQQDVFLFNTNLQLTREQEEIRKLKKLMDKDDQIIRLRNRVKTASESKYKNGIYQINDLIRNINTENQARQTKALHEIQYLMSIYNYKHIQGN